MSKAKIVISVLVICTLVGILCGVLLTKENYLNDDYIKLAKYKGLIYKIKSSKVSDKELQDRIQAERDARSTEEEVKSGKVDFGETIQIIYNTPQKFKENDKPQQITVGDNQLPGDMDEKLVDMKVGKTSDIVVNDGKNKTHYRVLVKSRTVSVPAKYDDEFLEDVGYDSKEEFEKHLKKEIQKEKKAQNLEDTKYELLYEVVTKSEIKKYPQGLVEKEKKKIVDAYKEAAADTTWESFLKNDMGITQKEFDKQMETTAKEQTKADMVIQYIAKKENISVSDREYKNNLKELLKEMEVSEKEFKEQNGMTIEKYAENNRFKMSYLTDKVTEFIFENAKEDK